MNKHLISRKGATVAIITAIAASSILISSFLMYKFEAAHADDEQLVGIREHTNRLSTLEWQAIGEGKLEPGVKEKAGEAERSIAARIDALGDCGENCIILRQSYSQYRSAVRDEFALLAEGRVEEARRTDAEKVDPGFEQLNELTRTMNQNFQNSAYWSAKLSLFESALTVATAFLLIGLLLSRYEKRGRAEQAALTERNALQESEKRLRSITGSAAEGIITIDGRGKITEGNPWAADMFGYPAEEFVGRSIQSLIPEKFRDARNKIFDSLVASPGQSPLIGRLMELSGQKKNGRVFPVEISISRWQQKDETFFTVFLRDISERKEKEEKINSQSKVLDRANRELAALYELSSVATQLYDLDELLARSFDKISKLEDAYLPHQGGIFLVEGDRLRLAYRLERDESFMAAHENMAVGDCLCGQVAKTGAIITSTNSLKDSRHTIRYPGMTAHGHVIIPLKTAKGIVGVMYLYLAADVKLDKSQLKFCQGLGDQLGSAIEKTLLYQEIKRRSLHDPLTGLANRKLMEAILNKSIARAKRIGESFAVIMIDLDHFKDFNDTYGHIMGDRMLTAVASFISCELREVDLAARYGGEEFVAILTATGAQAATEIAERIRTRISSANFQFDNERIMHMTVSLGVATCNGAASCGEDIIARADAALYQAKNSGRNQVALWRPDKG